MFMSSGPTACPACQLLTSQVLPGPLPLRLASIAVIGSGGTPAPVTLCPTATVPPEFTEPTVSTP